MGTKKMPKKESVYGFSHLCQLRAPTKFRRYPPVFALGLKSHLSASEWKASFHGHRSGISGLSVKIYNLGLT
jgi:hypothetical protein